MPDWSYRTLLRPALFTLSPERARDLMLGTTATLAALPGGALLIESFGDLAPPPALSTVLAGLSVRSPIGAGVSIDTTGRAARVWESLGVGFIEVGPITEQPVPSPAPIVRHLHAHGLIVPDVPVNPGLDVLCTALARIRPLHVPVAMRLAYRPDVGPEDAAREQRGLARRLAPRAALFTLDWTRALGPHRWGAEAWSAYLAMIDPRDGAVWAGRPILAAISPDADPSILSELLVQASDSGIQGIVVGDGLLLPDRRRHVGPVALHAAVATVRTVRTVLGDGVPVVAAGGITNPADALPLMDAGANAVEVTSGLVSAETAARALGRQGEPALQPLLDALRNDDDEISASAAEALGYLGDKRAVDALIEALENPEIRPFAVEALGRIGDPRAVPPLEALRDDPSRLVRRYVAEALESLNPP